MNRAWTSTTAALILCSWATSARAVKPEEWKHDQPKDFLSAKLENVVVSSLGEVTLGHETRSLEKLGDDVEVVNALARAGDGKVYAATGPTGQIYQVDGDTVKAFAKVPEGDNVLSLVFAADGFLLAGTGGGEQAHIYRIDKSGKASVFYDPPDAKYVWAMVRGPAGEIYAATGIEGKIYRIDAAGKSGTVLADVKP
jgi:outer membrane protein assembly factor BamB